MTTGCGERSVKFFFKNGFRLRHTQSYQVERSVFDQLLLNHSQSAGAVIREQTAVRSVQFHEESASLDVESAAGKERIQARYVLDASGRGTLLGQQLQLKTAYPHLRKFSVFAHFEDVTREPGPEGTFTRMIREEDRWFWMIPLGTNRMSIGVVMDLEEFKGLGMSPEQFLESSIARQPAVFSRMAGARRVTPVFSTGDYSYRNRTFAGNRWLMAGDAAGFIDPVFSTGVFLALRSGEQAADTLHAVLDQPKRRAKLFARYDKKLHRVMDLYLQFVSGWYRHEFAEVIASPTRRFNLPGAVNAVLAGNVEGGFSIWWRMQLFYLVLFFQRFYPLCPRLGLKPYSALEPPLNIPSATPSTPCVS
jgi:flavin-dependent dehydrogenase